MSVNVNHLEGMRCPECESEGPFAIGVHTSVIVHDEEIDVTGADFEWDKYSPCTCQECDYDGKVGDFT